MNHSLLYRLSDNHPSHQDDDYQRVTLSKDVLLSELKMLLISRSRLPGIDNIVPINTSVLNYGIDDISVDSHEINERCKRLETSLTKTINRFEPRLSQMSLTSFVDDEQRVHFMLQGVYLTEPIVLKLIWNDSIGRFSFDE